MGDHTKADTDLIKECSRALSRIHREFDKHGNPAGDFKDELGHGGLRDVFDEFSDTWKDTRKKLNKDIKKLADATDTAAKSYDKIDTALANALRKAKKEGKKKK